MAETGKIRVLKVKEPRLDIKADREYVALLGASNISTKYILLIHIHTSSAIWSITAPSVRCGMDRRIIIDLTFIVSCGGTNVNYIVAAGYPANTWLTPNDDAGPRQYPIHSIIKTAECLLNDQAFSMEFSSIIHGLLKFGNTVEDRNYFMGASPHRPDVAGIYSNAGQYAGNRNPFATYYNSGEEDSRNIKFYATGINATSFSFRFIESLMISPFTWGQDDVQALFGIQHFDLTLNFENLQRILSGSARWLD